jgi:type IV secretory pathway TrbF-like protein
MALAASTLLTSTSLSVLALRRPVETPRVLMVDRYGDWRELPPMTQPGTPLPGHIVGMLQDWIRNARRISDDPVAFTDAWEEVKAHSTAPLLRRLEAFHIAQGERQRRERHRVQIVLGTVLPLAGSATSYQVEWREEAYGPDGVLLPQWSGYWKALVRIATFEDEIGREAYTLLRKTQNFRNPGGLFVQSVEWDAKAMLERPSGKEPR